MNRKFARRTNLNWEALEGRNLQSGFGGSFQVDKISLVLPYIEQDNLNQATHPIRDAGSGGQTQIIAILIG